MKADLDLLRLRDRAAPRLWAKVEKTDGCWMWRGWVNAGGYGRLPVALGHILAHRASWLLANGAIPDGLYVLHRCDVRRCVNPAHLFLGTLQENNADMRAKGRERHPTIGEKHPAAKLTERDVHVIREAFFGAGMSGSQIARRLGLAPVTINRIVTGRGWRHVPFVRLAEVAP